MKAVLGGCFRGTRLPWGEGNEGLLLKGSLVNVTLQVSKNQAGGEGGRTDSTDWRLSQEWGVHLQWHWLDNSG